MQLLLTFKLLVRVTGCGFRVKPFSTIATFDGFALDLLSAKGTLFHNIFLSSFEIKNPVALGKRGSIIAGLEKLDRCISGKFAL